MFTSVAWLWIGILLPGSVARAAEDTTLVKIRTLLEPMRTVPNGLLPGPRGATPPLTGVKHHLQNWIESRLHGFRDEEEADAFARELNAEIRKFGLSCDWQAFPPAKGCPARAQPGYLGDIKVTLAEALIVTTRVGIVCGFDESAYAYSFENGGWKRFWQSETDDYLEGKYVPLNFLHIQLSSRDDSRQGTGPNQRLLLALARDPAYCESNWYNVYYRVWQLRTDRPQERLLLDEGQEAFLADPVDGAVSPRDVLMEYSTRMAYTDFEIRRIVRHYVLRNGKLEREAPLALSPRDFTDEWMRTGWVVASQWSSAGANTASLQSVHSPENFEGGQYGPTVRCEQRPEHWQVGLIWMKLDGRAMTVTKRLYFLVRWQAPYGFSMVDVSQDPWTGCTERDHTADEPKTLFPVHSQ